MKEKLTIIVIALAVATAGMAREEGGAGCSQRMLATLHRVARAKVNDAASSGCAALAKGHEDAGLGLLEEAMRLAVGDHAAFGVLQSVYWPAVQRDGLNLRAAGFFRGLKTAHPDDPEVLAAAGSAIGMALPELAGAGAPAALSSRWAGEARSDYARALEIDPDNFSARLGRAIFTSHIPGRFDECDRQFRELIALRRRHPRGHEPWGLVYLRWAQAASRNGRMKRAQEILGEGRAALPGDPILAHATIR
ncbi:MAG: hypothetical protein GXP47_08060 [Acidobacteria bacterium]|nr:hypothetical protein [Acidobacteriota bacterium]